MNNLFAFLAFLILYIIWTVYELVLLHRFNLKNFESGVKIYKRKIDFRFIKWEQLDGIYKCKEAKYVFVPELREGYFVTRYRTHRYYNPFVYSRGMPLTVFGKFNEESDQLVIEYKISYRVVTLISLWLIFCIFVPVFNGDFTNIGIGLLVSVVSFFFIYLWYLFLEGKLLIISDEIAELLKIDSNASKSKTKYLQLKRAK